ncbi:hypothetical protein LTR62_005609 [Meristemomyces frigidus]|uniref:Uncharacterized protein n=1 Tax=Meristemomyces frigidus TaxID=1508187 RepID=A0AAN7TF69_9PEZI|nr:hypothetical protein LTR62_005609 [Meristemomyces frigidus]
MSKKTGRRMKEERRQDLRKELEVQMEERPNSRARRIAQRKERTTGGGSGPLEIQPLPPGLWSKKKDPGQTQNERMQ